MEKEMLRPEEKNIVDKAEKLTNFLDKGTDWVSLYLQNPIQKKSIEKILHENLIDVKRIKASANRPVAIGVFGASQCGKSYLISQLVCGSNEKNVNVYLNKQNEETFSKNYDYLSEINPAGGRESTAIATRFTKRPYKTVPGCSAFIRLLNITDIIKIFMNGYFFECINDSIPTSEEIQKLKGSFKSKGSSGSKSFLAEDDVWDLQNYAREHFHGAFYKELENNNYWNILNNEVRNLCKDDQILFLEVLWGKIPQITNLFKFLCDEREKLGGECVGIFEEALIPREYSVIDVQRLHHLNRSGGNVTVVTCNGSYQTISSSSLCALTSELVLTAAPSADKTLLDDFDVLDFPGARARAKQFDEKSFQKAPVYDGINPITEVLLRGKVAYLFDKFTDDRDVTALLLCQQGGNQEAKSLPYMVNKWVEKTHGPDAKSREGKIPLLFHVFTKFDEDLVTKGGEDKNVRWESRLKTNFEDFLGNEGDWVNEWNEKTPFKNCYWVRNPQVQQAAFGRTPNGEIVNDQQALDAMHDIYIHNPLVLKHFEEPEEAWKQAATPNNSGIGYLVSRLKAGIDLNTKVNQLEDSMNRIYKKVKADLERFYIGDDVVKARKEKQLRAQKCLMEIQKFIPTNYSFSRLMDVEHFTVSSKAIEMIYDSIINPMIAEDEYEVSADSGNNANGIDLGIDAGNIFNFGEMGEEVASVEVRSVGATKSKGEKFADAVLDRWQKQITDMAQDNNFARKSGLSSELISEISQELIKGAIKQKIREKIVDICEEPLAAGNSGKYAEIVAARSSAIVNNYVTELGEPRKEIPIPENPPKVAIKSYPGAEIFKHWGLSLIKLFMNNVAEATEADEKSNEALAAILSISI